MAFHVELSFIRRPTDIIRRLHERVQISTIIVEILKKHILLIRFQTQLIYVIFKSLAVRGSAFDDL